jgi:hypothetical protein
LLDAYKINYLLRSISVVRTLQHANNHNITPNEQHRYKETSDSVSANEAVNKKSISNLIHKPTAMSVSIMIKKSS